MTDPITDSLTTSTESSSPASTLMAARFRGFMPVVIDVETGGFNPQTDALLEIAAVFLKFDGNDQLQLDETHQFHVKPFVGSNIEPASLKVTGIDLDQPLRPDIEERDALQRIFRPTRQALRKHHCQRALLVGHNAFFDMLFLNAAVERTGIKRNPFHPFTSFDTATLAGVAYGQTVLARAMEAAGFDWQADKAHSAAYDAEQTAKLFCDIVNRWQPLYEQSINGSNS
ncbi:MAG: ribonuclease T [Gammaproteobacteria bacterium]|nr:ribonuclease T [Gammaproteobacteria bacterium]